MKIKRLKGVLGVGLSAGLVIASLAAVFAVPAVASEMEWSLENTPSWDDMVILPSSDILDYDIGGDGDTIFAVLAVDVSDVGFDGLESISGSVFNDYALVKSTDGGVTWSDITANINDAANLPAPGLTSLVAVSVATDDEDWVAVAGYQASGIVQVMASKDGGDNFAYAGDIEDTYTGTDMISGSAIFDMDVSIESGDIHNIAVAGIDSAGEGCIFRLKAGTWLTGSWADTTYNATINNSPVAGVLPNYAGWMDCDGVIAVEFSPNFDMDDTIVSLCVATDIPYMQTGLWESDGDWNDEGGFGGEVQIKSDGTTIYADLFKRSLGLSLPADYDGSDPGARAVFVYVDGIDDLVVPTVQGFVFRIDNGSVGLVCGPSGNPVLASIDVHGDADTGKVMIGEYLRFDSTTVDPLGACCCEGVRVWHTEELDFCCPQWDGACKDPSGPYMALVMYTPDGEKEYASTSGTIGDIDNPVAGSYAPAGLYNAYIFNEGIVCDGSDLLFNKIPTPGTDYAGMPLDESAFSVSLDDAVSFNQIGLIDTDIDWLSDVAICPDCSVIYLSTINDGDAKSGGLHPTWDVIAEPLPPVDTEPGVCACDSVWRSYDNGDTWERVFYGDWVDDGSGWRGNDELLLRLPCDTDEECCVVYMAVKDQKNNLDQIYYTRDCGQCWNNPPATKIDIQDVAIESENIVYVIDDAGNFSMSTQYGRRWTDSVDTGLDASHTITSCCNEGFIVVGGNSGDAVAWSDDGGDSWNTTDDLPEGGEAHVACDPECDNIIYAAVDGVGIFRTDVTSGAWDDLNALAIDYTGIAVARTGGTLYAASDEIGIDTDEGLNDWCLDRMPVVPDSGTTDNAVYSGVARNLTPCETACCGTEDWDYLICGMASYGDLGGPYYPYEDFDAWTSSLRICGCLSLDTNSILWAIDTDTYDVTDGSGDNDLWGGLWSYEDCAAKHGPDLVSPADGSVLDCELCAGCGAQPFTMKWERMCNACSYDIEIMDEDGNLIVDWVDIDITGTPPSLYVDELGITCGETYTWHVREANTSCECVHSPWSETWSFTVTVGGADAISLLAPDEGSLGVPVSSVGFSWTSVPDADSYTFVLSPNANLTGALVSQDQADTAFDFAGPLDYSKAYYWQVKAWKGSVLLTTSSTGVFNTVAEPVEPTPPVVVNETPAPIIEIPAAQNITPTWIYAIIGIGAALAVVVIVLIVRTRRP